MKLKHFHYLFFFLVVAVSSAQQPVSIHLTEKDGLPDIEFYDILEDNDGFIWLAADKGLFRYDGKNYKHYTHPEKRGRSLFRLTLDNKGRVWSNNLSGQFFYTEGDNLVLFKDFEDINALVDFNIFKNHLIIKNRKKITTVNIETKQIASELDERAEAYLVDLNENKQGFYFNKNNIIYFTDNVALKKPYPINTIPFATDAERGIRKFFDFNEEIFYFNQLEKTGKNSLFQLKNKKIHAVKIPDTIANTIIVHTYQIANRIWVLTNNGIFVCNIKNYNLKIEEHYFKGFFTTDVLIDNNNNFWITTFKNGVYVMPNTALKKIDLPKNTGVTVIEKIDKNNLFLATSNHEIFNFKKQNNQLYPSQISFKNRITNICYNKHSDDVLIAATTESVLHDRIQQKSIKKRLFSTKSISVIDKDNYLISQSYNLSMYNKVTDTVLSLRQFRSYGSVLNTFKDKAYCNFIDGLGVIDIKTRKYKPIIYKGKPVFASRIAINDDDIVWVAIDGKGLYGFKNDTLIYQLTKKEGLASNLINVIKPDGKTIWLVTDKGLQCYNYETKEIITINREDGIDSYNITGVQILGEDLFYASNTGLYKFNKSKILKTKKIMQPYFTSVAIKEKDTLLKTKYNLKQNESEIKIGFNTNGFQSNKFIDYEYQLEGYNDKWVSVESGIDFVKFNTLPTGTFNFNLRAKNKFQEDYTKPITIVLKVRLPFYKTWWFYCLLFLLCVLFIWYYFVKKTKRLKVSQNLALEKAQINQQLVFSQLENLRSQMNPHFIFNALNSIQDYIILNEKKLARVYLVKFSRLIRTYLEHSQKNEVALNEEIKALKLYLELEKDRFNDDFDFQINIDKTLNLETTFVPSLFIQPYAENALKHGLLHKKVDKKLQLNFTKNQENNQLICEIIDNGIGRKASAIIKNKKLDSYKSFATSANQKRVNLLNKSLDKKIQLDIVDVLDKNKAISGTKVIIKINIT